MPIIKEVVKEVVRVEEKIVYVDKEVQSVNVVTVKEQVPIRSTDV